MAEGTDLLNFYKPGTSPGDSTSGAPRKGTATKIPTWGEPRSEDAGEGVEADRVVQTVRKTWRVRRLGLDGINQSWWMVDEYSQQWKIVGITNVGSVRVKIDVHCELVVT